MGKRELRVILVTANDGLIEKFGKGLRKFGKNLERTRASGSAEICSSLRLIVLVCTHFPLCNLAPLQFLRRCASSTRLGLLQQARIDASILA